MTSPDLKKIANDASRRDARSAPAAASPRRALAEAFVMALGDLLDDPPRLRRALGQVVAIEGDLAAPCERLLAWLDARPDGRRETRDREIVAFAGNFEGDRSLIAAEIARELDRYSRRCWPRDRAEMLRRHGEFAWTLNREKIWRPAASREHPFRPRLFEITRLMGDKQVRENKPPLGDKQIARILARPCYNKHIRGHLEPVSMSGEILQIANRRNPEARDMNAHSPSSNADFVEALKQTSLGKSALAEQHAARVTERRALVDEIEAWHAKAAAELPKFDKKIAEKTAAVRAAEKALAAANRELGQAGFQKSAFILQVDTSVRRAEETLRNSPAAPVLDRFRTEMLDEIDATRKQHVGGMVQEINPLAPPDKRVVTHAFGNAASVNARFGAIRAALAEIETLRLVADQSNLELSLDALRAGLPPVARAVIPTLQASEITR